MVKGKEKEDTKTLLRMLQTKINKKRHTVWYEMNGFHGFVREITSGVVLARTCFLTFLVCLDSNR